MRFGTWNVRSLRGAGSVTAAAAGELARYKLDLAGVEEARWGKGDTVRAEEYIYIFFSIEKETKINWEQASFSCTPQNIIGSYESTVFFGFFTQDSPL